MKEKQYKLTAIVDNWIFLLEGPDPFASLKAEEFLRNHRFELLVSVRHDVNYPISWAHRPDDPKCRFRTHIRCFSCYIDPNERDLFKQNEKIKKSTNQITETDFLMFNEFCLYELAHKRTVPIWFQEPFLREAVIPRLRTFFSSDSDGLEVLLSKFNEGQRQRIFTALQRYPEWLPDLMSHATTVHGACKIIESGAILSSCKIHGVSGEALVKDGRNFVADPADYFEYVMLSEMKSPINDWVVYQRVVDRSPTNPENPLTWQEFSDNFLPAVNLVFRTLDLIQHPLFCCDGLHAVKVRDQLELDPYLAAMVVPKGVPKYEQLLQLLETKGLSVEVISEPFSGFTPEEWAERMYKMVQQRLSKEGAPNKTDVGDA